jgi:hypothetical protein
MAATPKPLMQTPMAPGKRQPLAAPKAAPAPNPGVGLKTQMMTRAMGKPAGAGNTGRATVGTPAIKRMRKAGL